jgi:E3 ubiquitin-protein ligase HERC4
VHVVDIVVGNEHCLALADDGKVWAWGNNSHGQLGLSQVRKDGGSGPVQEDD